MRIQLQEQSDIAVISTRKSRRAAMERSYCAQNTDCLQWAIAARRMEGVYVRRENTRGLEGHCVWVDGMLFLRKFYLLETGEERYGLMVDVE